MFPKCVFKYIPNCITIVWVMWESLTSQQATKPRRQNGRRERKRSRWGHGKGMREWSKSQNTPNVRDHRIQLTLPEGLSWTVTYLKHPGRPQTPPPIHDWLFPSYIKMCCKCFFTREHLLEISAG